MDVNIYTVCEDESGTINRIGEIVPVTTNGVDDYYSFYATRMGKKNEGTLKVRTVMPLGGANGGLFRFPQVGDSVLVGRLGDTTITGSEITLPSGDFVLIGYMPDTDTKKRFYPNTAKDRKNDDKAPGFQAEQKNPGNMKDFKQDKGMALRYNCEAIENTPVPAIFTSLTQRSDSNNTTTSLILAFDQSLDGFTADCIDIAPTGEVGATIEKDGALTGTGSSYTLPIKVNEGGCIAVTVTVPGYTITGGPKAVAVQIKGNPATPGNLPVPEPATTTEYKQDVTKQTEIGFYHKNAKWPNMSPEERKKDANHPLTFSPQDTVNIQSAGDIESRADNYQILSAKRFEIVVNTNELSPCLRYDNADSKGWDSAKAPMGDTPLDDPMLHKGDMHIRAGRNVIIKANNEIRLQVGRTVVVINDGGFSVVTQKINSGVGLGYDTSFNMTPRGGISMSGQKVAIHGVNGFALGDSWGAAVNGSIGGLNLTGRFIKQSNMNTFASAFMLLANSTEAAQNIAEGAATVKNPPSSQEAFSKSIWGFNLAQTFITDIELICPLLAKFNSGKKFQNWVNGTPNPPGQPAAAPDAVAAPDLLASNEPIELLTLALNMVLNLTGVAYAAVETDWAIKWRDDLRNSGETGEPLKYPSSTKSEMRDTLNLCALSIDNGIIALALDVATAAMMATSIPGASAEIRLRPSGDIVINAAQHLNNYGTTKTNNATSPYLFPRWTAEFAKSVTGAAKLGVDVAKLVASYGATYDRVKPWLEKL
jgi:hypothetical protein